MSLFDKVTIGGEILSCKVNLDDTLIDLSSATDYSFDGTSSFQVPSFIPPEDFEIGIIIGPSGTGKSSLLKHFGEVHTREWERDKAVASQVSVDTLMYLGLSSIPSLCRPYHVLSEGEKHRADIARALDSDCRVFDEFTSVVHRALARSISIGLRKLIKDRGIGNVVLATCHEDVCEWLDPSWVFNTFDGTLSKRRLERQPITFRLLPCSTKAWAAFKNHHYLTDEISKGAHCWILIDHKNNIIGFSSAIPLPHPTIRNAWREHRTVILPDYQGMGLGSRLSNMVAQMFLDRGKRYFSKTAHPKLGEHRERSNLWRPTTHNKENRSSGYERIIEGRYEYYSDAQRARCAKHKDRICYAHEYIGQEGNR